MSYNKKAQKISYYHSSQVCVGEINSFFPFKIRVKNTPHHIDMRPYMAEESKN